MFIRPCKSSDAQGILDILKDAYKQSRYNDKFAIKWVECFIKCPLIYPSYVVEGDNSEIIGYIVWKVRQLSNNNVLTLELQELTAHSGSKKLITEKLLFDETPACVIKSMIENGFKIEDKCFLDIWIHSEDKQSNKSVLYGKDGKFGKFLGGFEKKNARGELILLYQQEYKMQDSKMK